ncbi:hypothetical protein F5B22DRAFT_76525 [Xylaria bambusicola]|uniref:uncharacterized protein n=1 Tax=Xylaria bambusicola TaxID=326684 RepID=UPI002007EE01|nr:uncharacterized protein F5B22DRAFT_76525 [Xylaria bambusicola]KAI0518206.1 hypothetical protein F5B22DRAFT_76525 [Xylaria bambusicola]
MRTMIHRHLHGHGHSRGHHLRSREPVLELDERDQGQSIELDTHDILHSDHHVPQITTRANNLDEKPSTDSSTTTIVISVVIPLVVALAVLAYFARKGVLRRRREEAASKFKSMDFGLQETLPSKGGKRKSAFFGKEKEGGHKTQLSMDMNLSSPYLLPPNLHASRESFNSLAKTLHQADDPYRPVTDYAGSDVGSLRSFKRGPATRTSSIYTSKTRPSGDIPRQQREIPTSPLQSPLPVAQPLSHSPAQQEEMLSTPAKNEFRFVDDGPGVTQVPEIQEPAAVATLATRKPATQSPRSLSPEVKEAPVPMVAEIVDERDSLPRGAPNSQMHTTGLGIMDRHMSQASSTSQSSDAKGMPMAIRPPRKESMPVINAPKMNQEYQGYDDHMQFEDNQFSSHRDEDELHMSVHHEQNVHPHSAGLGVPDQDNRRLSVGLRPLPPDDFLESEDPEFRANRIRSFYKEYFDDSKADQNRPPMPQPKQGGYYEDYDAGYMGEAAYFDPDTNAFVMPYAQPVTRRAMTPPPNNRRPMPGPGPRGPPGPHGPHRGPPMSGGPQVRPRAGSTMSGRAWGPRSPRPGSSASNPRFGGQPKKPMPPPAALNSLPTPSKLKDDSFALMGAVDFAPPPSFKDQATGRSQSPLGERVPYRVNTPVHSPLVSAFDDTPALPSPHLLRKSGTFTGLDFAPPRRFKDPETMSETGSVRSMHSGISGMGLNALRAGAGRVSRLPGDTVFTQAAMNDTLKPNWGMRD